MTYILWTDTHFGVKQNSATWLNSQMDFIYKQFIPHIKSIEDDVTVVHLGDVFDSRSTISTLVATKVVEAFRDIKSVCKEVIVIGGNHDYYSPNSDEVDSLSLFLGPLGITLVTKDVLYRNGDAFVPWYKWGEEMPEGFNGRIFAHSDIVTETIPSCYAGISIFTGHIHIPKIRTETGAYNIGSCYALNFADANDWRGFYQLKGTSWKFIPNVHSINYWRLYDDEIFDVYKNAQMKDWDYVEFYISQNNLETVEYTEKLNEMMSRFKNARIVPQNEEVDSMDMEKFEGYNIEEIIKGMVPEHLKDKFGEVLRQLQNVPK